MLIHQTVRRVIKVGSVVQRISSRPLLLSTCHLKAYATTSATMSSLEKLHFDNRILRSLPIDEERRNYNRTVSGSCYSLVDPTPVDNPVVVATSASALELLCLTSKEIDSPKFGEYFSGNNLLPGSQPAAHCYCGHQFGNFSGQLGDGCAHYLGEVVNERGERWELQLKGSGMTPYSRRGDGRKVLRSSIREFLCSEAMHNLGIPTTRSGSCVTSDTKVVRDIFYTGNNILERATVISRIAPTFLRFGSFEIFKIQDPVTMRTGPSVGNDDLLFQLVDYTIQSYYPEIYAAHPSDRTKRTGVFFQELCVRTAHLVAMWQCVGFCHGVLNTDNMSIVGITIDYGPYGFLDVYNPGHICNGSDDSGRYAFDKQPSICKWNLQKLAEALSKCLSKEDAERGLELYDCEFKSFYLSRMRRKLGLIEKQLPEDLELVHSFHQALHKTGCDFTNGFRQLNRIDLAKLQDSRHIERVVDDLVNECTTPDELAMTLRPRMSKSQILQMKAIHTEAPLLLTQLGISGELLDQELEKIETLEAIKSSSAEEKKEMDKKVFAKWFESYVSRLMTEIKGVPVDQLNEITAKRVRIMNSSNPRFLLRNHLLQHAIKEAEKGDFSEVRRLLERSQSPYLDEDSIDDRYCSRPSQEALDIRVT